MRIRKVLLGLENRHLIKLLKRKKMWLRGNRNSISLATSQWHSTWITHSQPKDVFLDFANWTDLSSSAHCHPVQYLFFFSPFFSPALSLSMCPQSNYYFLEWERWQSHWLPSGLWSTPVPLPLHCFPFCLVIWLRKTPGCGFCLQNPFALDTWCYT